MDDKVLDAAVARILAEPDEPLDLARLSAPSGYSPAHFHKAFKQFTGETPARYVERVRLTRAAQFLLLHEASVVDVAFATGYRNHETFTRAFRRFYGLAPSAYRLPAQQPRRGRASAPAAGISRLSSSSVCRLRDLHYVARRCSGPYETVDVAHWHTLAAMLARLGSEIRAFAGMGLDDPSVTPAAQLRFDAMVFTDRVIHVDPPLHSGTLAVRHWARTLHAGSYQALPEAYPHIVEQVTALAGVSMSSEPPLEIYQSLEMQSGRTVEFTEVYLPIILQSAAEVD